jgi:tetratricopeptide (TPR) repeat protein
MNFNFKNLTKNQKIGIIVTIFTVFLFLFLFIKTKSKNKIDDPLAMYLYKNKLKDDRLKDAKLDEFKTDIEHKPFGYREYKSDDDPTDAVGDEDMPTYYETLEDYYNLPIPEDQKKHDPMLSRVTGRAQYKAELNPDSIMGYHAFEEGKIDEAEEYFQKAINRDPTNPFTRVYSHGALMEINKIKGNNEEYKKHFNDFSYWHHATDGDIAEQNGKYFVEKMPDEEEAFQYLKTQAETARTEIKKVLNGEYVPLEEINAYLKEQGINETITEEKLQGTLKVINDFFPE